MERHDFSKLLEKSPVFGLQSERAGVACQEPLGLVRLED